MYATFGCTKHICVCIIMLSVNHNNYTHNNYNYELTAGYILYRFKVQEKRVNNQTFQSFQFRAHRFPNPTDPRIQKSIRSLNSSTPKWPIHLGKVIAMSHVDTHGSLSCSLVNRIIGSLLKPAAGILDDPVKNCRM